jgi:hypothetical protein
MIVSVIFNSIQFDNIFSTYGYPDFKYKISYHVMENLYFSDNTKIDSISVHKRIRDLEANDLINQLNLRFNLNYQYVDKHNFQVSF